MPYFPAPAQVSALAMQPGPVREVSGHRVMDLPGGVFAMGSRLSHEKYRDAPPRLVKVDAFSLGLTPVTEGQFQRTLARPSKGTFFGPSKDRFREDFAANVSWFDAEAYVKRHGLGLATEAEQEFAGRGPAVDMRRFMEEMQFTSAMQLIDYLREYHEPLENAVNTSRGLVLGAKLISDIYSAEFEALVESAVPFVMWRGFNTVSGRLTQEEAYYDHEIDGPVAVNENLRRNGYGLSDMLGGMWEWSGDVYDRSAYMTLTAQNPENPPIPGQRDDRLRVYRGGSWFLSFENSLRSAYRGHDGPGGSYNSIGFRVAAAAPQYS